jgi:hypothetical protein
MISILFSSRVKGNPDSDIRRLLDSVLATASPAELGQIEFLIKYDDDDDERPPDGFFAAYPFPVRTFVWSRGEGRHSLHQAQEYLFAQRDPRARFCMVTADDFYFTRPGWVSDILRIPDEFCIVGDLRPGIEVFAGIYEQEAAVRKWAVAFRMLAPAVSARLIEVCQNFGWQANVDSWLMALSVVLYDLYEVVIWRTVEPYYTRGGGYGLGDTPTYNNMEVTCRNGPLNKYWFELVRRQARNVYLNMKHGTDLRRLPAWSPLRLWRKVSAQSLHRLPLRLCKRLWKGVRGASDLPPWAVAAREHPKARRPDDAVRR